MSDVGGFARKPLAVIAAILVTATLLILPAALGPVRVNDSFWIDWVWLDQFARELGSGVPYPRWLPLSHGGLGSPDFYYYPPLAFYGASTFVLAGLSVYAALLATFFLGYVLSGAGMFWWLKDRARMPLVGALAYMIAPYHACNFYLRGALAEFVAAAFLPFVMLGIARLQTRERGGFALTALGYAALIFSHLPLALLASLFLIGPYAAIESYRTPRQSLYIVTALATGILFAGIYLVPALALEPYRDAAKLWENATLQPQNWSFWHHPAPGAYPAMLVIGAALALPLAIIILSERSRWALVGFICVLLGIGLIPIVWELPLIRSVQFPFRILPLVEFALAAALAGVGRRPVLAGLSCLPLLALTASIVTGPRPPGGMPMRELATLHPDVPENLPPGERPYTWPSRWALGIASSNRRPRIEGDVTIAPVFYFPSWRVTCEGLPVATFADPQTRLLAYRGRNCSRELVWTSPEKLGAAISGLGLLVLLLFGASGRARRLRRASAARKGDCEEVIA